MTSSPRTTPLLLLLLATASFSSVQLQQFKSDEYVTAGLDGKSFSGQEVLITPAVSLLACSTRCSEQEDCVAFTFLPGTSCTGHSACMTPETDWTPAPGARTFNPEGGCGPTCGESGLRRLTDPSLELDQDVPCDEDWIVFQRRQDGSVDFYRNWANYTDGFGDPVGEYWLGLDVLHKLTTADSYELHVELTTWSTNTTYWAAWTSIVVGPPETYYNLTLGTPTTSSTAVVPVILGGYPFSTWDANHDTIENTLVTAEEFHGGWWYCGADTKPNPNGRYCEGTNGDECMTWGWMDFGRSLRGVQMKIRPVQ